MSIYTYHVPGMGPCCAESVKNAIKSTPFKTCKYEVDAATQMLTLELADDEVFQQLEAHEVDDLVLSALRRKAGFDATVANGGVKKSVGFSHAVLGGIGLSSGFLLLLLPLFFTAIPFALTAVLAFLSAGLTLGLGWPFYRRACLGLWQGIWTMDTLFSISTAVIVGVSLGALLMPALPMMFEAGLLIFGFRHTGIAIADAFKANLLKVRRFQDEVPETLIWINDEGEDETIPRDAVEPRMRLRLSVGERLPVDGVFESGDGTVSRLYETGSYQSTNLALGTTYFAGTKLDSISDSEPLVFRVTQAANNSFLAREDRAILESKLNSALEKKKPSGVTYWLQYFVPVVVSVAALSGLFVGLYFGSFILAVQCAVGVLVAACPCTLGLIAPLVTHVGIKKIEKAGIIFRKPEDLEAADKIDCVMFDLNGTLTRGTPEILNPEDEDNQVLIGLMAHLEANQDHWVARAIKAAAHNLNLTPIEGACDVTERTHHGIKVSFDGDDYILGNREMMAADDIAGLDAIPTNQREETVVCLSKNGELHGHLILKDAIRSDAVQVIDALKASGKKVYLCTGSDGNLANQYAGVFGISEEQIFSSCETDGERSKLARLEALKAMGYHVAMIGDSVNDASVIAKSDFGLVVQHEAGHKGAQQGASAVLRTESLSPVLQLFEIARKTTSNINQNVWFSFVYNAIAMLAPAGLLLGVGLALNPAVGAGLMILQTLLIFANVYRFNVAADSPVENKTPIVPLNTDAVSAGLDLNSHTVSSELSLSYASSASPVFDTNDEAAEERVVNNP
jgi:P-type Cu2+ transporter